MFFFYYICLGGGTMSQKTNSRNHMLAPRSVFNTSKIYRLYILKELAKGRSLYGKQVYDAFKEHFKGYPVPVSYSTIYDTLHGLEERNLVQSHWDTADAPVMNRTKRYYRITDEGLAYYQKTIPEFVQMLKKNKAVIDKFIELLQ